MAPGIAPVDEDALARAHLYAVDRQICWIRSGLSAQIRASIDWDDVRSHLNIGLVRAIRSYRPDRKATLGTWIITYLRGYWSHYWRDKQRYYILTVQIPELRYNTSEVAMALYDYRCSWCGHTWESLVTGDHPEIPCELCHQPARRLPCCPAVVSVCDTDNKSALQTANLLDQRREAAANGHGNLTIKCTANARGEITIDDVVKTGGTGRRTGLSAEQLRRTK